MNIQNVVMVVSAFSCGFLVAGGVIALIVGLGIVTRLVGITHTAKENHWYESMVFAGAVFGNMLTVYQIPRKVTTNRPTGAEALKTDASKRVFWLSNKLNGKTMLYMKKFDGIADPDHDTTDVTDSDATLDNCIGEYVTGFTVAKSTSDAKVTITLELKQGKQKYSITNEFKLRNALQ